MSQKQPKVGDLYYANVWYWDPHTGRKAQKKRPVVIVEVNSLAVQAVGLSVTGSGRVKRPKASDITVEPSLANRLKKTSVVATGDSPSIVRFANLSYKLGELDPEDLARVKTSYSLFGVPTLRD